MNYKVHIELWNLIVPLASVLEASAGPRTRTAHVLLVFISDSENRGIGYSIFRQQGGLEQATQAAERLVAASGSQMTALFGQSIRNLERLRSRQPARIGMSRPQMSSCAMLRHSICGLKIP